MKRSLLSPFQRHPNSVGESYLQHMGSASGFAGRMFVGAIACFLHGLLPFLFEKTGSQQITVLHDRMVINRHRDKSPVVAARTSQG